MRISCTQTLRHTDHHPFTHRERERHKAVRTLSITGGQQDVKLFKEDRGRGVQRERVDGGERLNKKN